MNRRLSAGRVQLVVIKIRRTGQKRPEPSPVCPDWARHAEEKWQRQCLTRWESQDDATAERDERAEMLDVSLELLRDFADDNECQFDHHGDCQAHGSIGATCRNVRIKDLLDWRAAGRGHRAG